MQVTIVEGSYRGEEVHNQSFEMITEPKDGAKGWFVTVRPNEEIGTGRDKIRVKIHGPDCVLMPHGVKAPETSPITKAVQEVTLPEETDEEVEPEE